MSRRQRELLTDRLDRAMFSLGVLSRDLLQNGDEMEARDLRALVAQMDPIYARLLLKTANDLESPLVTAVNEDREMGR